MGNVRGQIANTVLEGLGGSGIAAGNPFGIVMQLGAQALMSQNTITLHGTGPFPFATGMDVCESDEPVLTENVIRGTDSGIFVESDCTVRTSANLSRITDSEVEARLTGMTLSARVDRHRVVHNELTTTRDATGVTTGIVLETFIFPGGTNTPNADGNVIVDNTICGYTNPIFTRGATNIIVRDND